jgi:hypothetical protein
MFHAPRIDSIMKGVENRNRFDGMCKDVLSHNKAIIFAAVLDSAGKIIVAHANSYWQNNEKYTESHACSSIWIHARSYVRVKVVNAVKALPKYEHDSARHFIPGNIVLPIYPWKYRSSNSLICVCCHIRVVGGCE